MSVAKQEADVQQAAAKPFIKGKFLTGSDIGLAVGIIIILTVLFLPVPAVVLDIGLAFSIAFSVLILMVALWIQRPLDFSAFPTVLLIATMMRLSLNIATTRVILTHGNEGYLAAGHVIHGFSQFVMGGDFVIGLVVFAILIIVNFLVITKGATRIAEVGARFTLDAIPGKQMAIDADLSSGLIDEKEAQRRRRELEEESSFFGSMDGASKFVRGDAIAGLIITAVNIFGGIVIGATRHGMDISQVADVFTKLSVGDGLVTQIPALIVSLAAGPSGLSVLPARRRNGVRRHCRAARQARQREADAAEAGKKQREAEEQERNSVKASLETNQIELCLGKQLSARLIASQEELAHRVNKMRRKFAQEYGFVIPEIKVTDDIALPPKSYRIKIHGTAVASHELRVGEILVVLGERPVPSVPGEEVREPAFGMRAYSVPETFTADLRREGYMTVDNLSVLLTHLSEIVRNNLAQLLSYKDMRILLDRLGPEYRKLLEDICPAHISYSGLQAVLKLLLAERISIRNLHLILEAIAEIAPLGNDCRACADAHGPADLR
ncbi:flagellar biosynthesis protein flhA [Brucella sp. 63/311]|nr:flagellar biosynthesis protein flhA [Brucella sp. 63/311]